MAEDLVSLHFVLVTILIVSMKISEYWEIFIFIFFCILRTHSIRMGCLGFNPKKALS